jgi:putative tricarboxylic transport membrane protein
VGFYTATMVYVFAYTRFVGRHTWLVAVVLSVAISFGSFYVFERVLAILLPRGIYTVIPFFG